MSEAVAPDTAIVDEKNARKTVIPLTRMLPSSASPSARTTVSDTAKRANVTETRMLL